MKKLIVLFVSAFISAQAFASRLDYTLVIRNHVFEPATLEIPRDRKIRLLVDNQDATPEEFESYELNREKLVPGNSKIVIFIGPLKAGEYPFFGDFNPDTARGKLVVK